MLMIKTTSSIFTLGVFEPQDLHNKMTVCPCHRELLVPGGGAIDHAVPSLIGWLFTKAPRRLNAA